MASTYVTFTTNFGNIVIDLDNTDTPQTVQDFLSYAENMTVGDGYDDSFFHRLVPGFILQGGGYVANNGSITAIPTNAPVANEYSAAHPNVEGTVALAKVGGDPNSATDQFFFNLADNSSNLDGQNGGFTVFGTVTAATWPVVEAIAGLATVNAGGAFANLPYEGTLTNGAATTANLVEITAVGVGDTAPCFCRGTRIRTVDGEVPVELLAPGMMVLTASRQAAPIRWIASRRIDCRRHADPAAVTPVRVARHAFAPGVPCRDLLLSPDHAVFADGVLVPIRHLVNGRTIAPLPSGHAHVEYWHVELDRHDVILAEGLPAESFLDTGNRAAFDRGQGVVQLHADFGAGTRARACAELVTHGARLLALRARLFARAGGARPRPDLSLQVLAGQDVLTPTMATPWRWCYAVPPGTATLRLRSPCWTPAALDPALLDLRRLGVRLHGVAIDGRSVVLDSGVLADGFHPLEITAEGPCRWTDGDARLVLPPGARWVMLAVGDETAAELALSA